MDKLLSYILIAIFFLLLILVPLNLYFQIIQIPRYGDTGSLDVVIAQSRPFTRWFLGSTLILDLYWKIWKPFFSQFFQNINYVQLLSALTMNISTIIFLQKFRAKLFIILPILTPLWIMFSLGYDEYYPFIAPIFLATLLGLFVIPHQSSFLTYIFWGTISGLLPLIYIGFTSLAFFILIYFSCLNLRKAPIIWLTAYGIFFFLIWRFWPWGTESFFVDLFQHLNFGETNTVFSRYFNHSGGSLSLGFSVNYALSLEHLQDLIFMLFFGGGAGSFLAFLSGLIIYLPRYHFDFKKINSLIILATVFIISQLYYFVFMIPKLGPIQDIDLFFTVYLTFAFFAGILWEKLIPTFKNQNFVKLTLILFYIGYSAVSLNFLLIQGLPKI